MRTYSNYIAERFTSEEPQDVLILRHEGWRQRGSPRFQPTEVAESGRQFPEGSGEEARIPSNATEVLDSGLRLSAGE